MNKFISIFFLIHLSTTFGTEKILIITHSFNRPDFIELQHKTFKAFLDDDYEYVVFNDASQEQMRQQIEQTCYNLGIRCFRVPQHIHNVPGRTSAGHRHMDGINYAFNLIGYDHDGIITLIDFDAFLIKPFSIHKYMEGYDLAGKLEGRANTTIRVRHLSPVLSFINMRTIPNKSTLTFEGGYVEGLACDVGAQSYYYLKNNPSVKSQFFLLTRMFFFKNATNCKACTNMSCSNCIYYLMDNGFDDKVITFIQSCPDDNMEFVLNHSFLHYRCGSNWNHKSAEYHHLKTKALNDFINNILE